MPATLKFPEFHRPLIEHPEDFRWYIRKEWSCPLHDHDVHTDWDEDGDEYEVLCTGCLYAGYKVYYDEDGWAELIFEEKSMMDKALETYYLPMIKVQLNSNLFLTEMEKIEWDT